MSSLIDARPARLSDTEFFAMVESGAFGDRRVYLWNGRLCEKMAKTNAQAFVAVRIAKALAAILPPGWDVWQESPIHLGTRHVPLPDLAVIRGPEERFRNATPGPFDAALVVEVAVSSLSVDLGKRAAAYAKAGVSCYWVADVAHGRIVEHRGPGVRAGVASYGVVRHHGPGDEVELVLDGAPVGRIPLSGIF